MTRDFTAEIKINSKSALTSPDSQNCLVHGFFSENPKISISNDKFHNFDRDFEKLQRSLFHFGTP